ELLDLDPMAVEMSLLFEQVVPLAWGHAAAEHLCLEPVLEGSVGHAGSPREVTGREVSYRIPGPSSRRSAGPHDGPGAGHGSASLLVEIHRYVEVLPGFLLADQPSLPLLDGVGEVGGEVIGGSRDEVVEVAQAAGVRQGAEDLLAALRRVVGA